MPEATADLPRWLQLLPVPEQQRFVALSLKLLRTESALRALPATGSLSWTSPDQGDVRVVAEAMRQDAMQVRERAGLLDALGRDYDEMASILESVAD